MSGISGVGGFRPPPPKPPSFETVDANSDGSLSLDEFQAGAPKGADSAKTEELFGKIDSNSDGAITQAEDEAFREKAEKADNLLKSFLFSLQSEGTQSASSSEETDIFQQIDSDSSGGISADEFTSAFGDSRLGAGDRLSELFTAIDSDGDGSASQDEVEAFQSALQQSGQRRGPPPPPPEMFQNASQAYGEASGLWSRSATTSSYSQAA